MSGQPGKISAGPRAVARHLAWLLPVLFPVLLLAGATLFLGGRTGFWSDDYWHNLRDPVSGSLPPLTWSGLTIDRGFFIRPLFYMIIPAVTTLAWEMQWPAHLLQTLAHALVIVLLWRLMMRMEIPQAAAGAASLLFMVYPAHFETVLWVSAIPTALATALMLCMMLLVAGMARGVGVYRRAGGWWVALVLPPLAFALCCLNEQPAMGVFALPLVHLAARPHARGGATQAIRTLLPAALAGLAVLLYAWLLISDPGKPAGARGSTSQFVALTDLPARSAYFFDVLWRRLVLRNFWRGALGLGWSELKAAGMLSMILAPVVFAAAAAWAWRWTTGERAWRPATPATSRPALAALVGLVIFATGWLPILALAVYDPDSRTRYWPMIGAAMLLASLLSGLAGPGRLRRALRGITSVVLIAAMLFGATCFIGIQSAFRARWRLDHEQGRQLVALLPQPGPLSFFVPLDIRSTGIRTGAPVLDSHFRSAWEFPWVTPDFIKGVYSRDDVRAGFYRGWTRNYPVIGASTRGLIYTDRLGPRFEQLAENRWLIPWDRAVPFLIDERAQIQIITHVIAGGEEFDIPQARSLPRTIFRIDRAD